VKNLAATILAGCFAVAFLGIVLGVYIPAVRFAGPGLSNSGLELLSGVIGALIGAVGVALPRELTGTRAIVALILACTLGGVALIVTGFVVYDSAYSSGPAISQNTGKILATLLGGILGALLGYLGLALPVDGEEPPRDDTGRAGPEV
jgi:hypothetical protein